MIKVNGKEEDGICGLSIVDLLKELGYDGARIAVGLNDAIVPKAAYGDVSLREGDRVEIVHFISGG